jgi:ribonuclease HI
MSAARDLQINIDGAARGNPGPAAFAYVITREGAPPVEAAGCIGIATNNVAEYTALVRALERARDLGGKRLLIRSDSELLVKQMNGVYKVKNDSL